MTAAHVTAVYLGHDPSLGESGTDLMFTVYSDGHAELAMREGRDQRWVTWYPPVPMRPEAHMPEAMHEGARSS